MNESIFFYTASSNDPSFIMSFLEIAGVYPEYLRDMVKEWDSDYRVLGNSKERLSHYEEMVKNSKDKFVRGFDFVRRRRCNRGSEWEFAYHKKFVNSPSNERSTDPEPEEKEASAVDDAEETLQPYEPSVSEP